VYGFGGIGKPDPQEETMLVLPSRRSTGRQGNHYDRIRTVLPWFERLAGESEIRPIAAAMLGTVDGETVLDVGCNVGQNTPHLLRATGQSGYVIGIDVASACVAQARSIALRCGWLNVEYRVEDAHVYSTGRALGGILMGYCFNVLDDPNEAVPHLLGQLRPGKRMVICDARIPQSIRSHWYGTIAAQFARRFLCADSSRDPVAWMRHYAKSGSVKEVDYKERGYTFASSWEKI
jgi:SAM-dependent methyltransferase